MLRLAYRENMFYDWLLELAYFPVWWYTLGFYKVLRRAWFFLLKREHELSWFIWFKNLFVPMYGQSDFIGRIISFFVRFFQIFFRGIFMLFYLLLVFAFLLSWVVLPPLIILALINNLQHVGIIQP